MGEYNEYGILEELEIFRWNLYNAKKEDEKEKQKSLLDEACRKPISEPFIEEWIIAGCDMTMVNVLIFGFVCNDYDHAINYMKLYVNCLYLNEIFSS